MPKEREPQYIGVTHIADNAEYSMKGRCGHRVTGPSTGHYQTDMDDFINRVSNEYSLRYTHCHWCEELLTIWDHINATEV